MVAKTADWAVQKAVPIACVDILPCLKTTEGETEVLKTGLIYRSDPMGRKNWNLIGGGVKRNESIEQAAQRHLRETLGNEFLWEAPDFAEPNTVGQYFPVPRDGFGHDPRKHAVAVTYVVRALTSEASPQGEADDFKWISLDGPLPEPIGFRQEGVIRRLLPSARVLLGEPPRLKIAASDVYQAAQGARHSWRSLAWQVPAVALAAQAVLFVTMIESNTSAGERFGASFLAALIMTVAFQLFLRHGYHEHLSELWLSKQEEGSNLPSVSQRKKLLSEVERDSKDGRVVGFPRPFSGLARMHSRPIWAWTLLVLIAVDLGFVVWSVVCILA